MDKIDNFTNTLKDYLDKYYLKTEFRHGGKYPGAGENAKNVLN
jgi:hypothetical protein